MKGRKEIYEIRKEGMLKEGGSPGRVIEISKDERKDWKKENVQAR